MAATETLTKMKICLECTNKKVMDNCLGCEYISDKDSILHAVKYSLELIEATNTKKKKEK